MKRVLFVVTYLSTGGITTALQNFLLNYNQQEYKIDVFSLSHQGIFNKSLVNCNLLPRNFLIHNLISRFSQLDYRDKVVSFIVKMSDRLTKGKVRSYLFKHIAKSLQKKVEYDAVVGFSEGIPTEFISIMNCTKKIAWIHCDYANYYSLIHKDELPIYQKMTHVVCVSEFTMKSFLSIYPSLHEKTTFIHNIVDSKSICHLSKDTSLISYDKNFINIVSVGRIDPVKRFSYIPSVVRSLIDRGHKVRWYIVGPASQKVEYDLLLKKIIHYDVVDSVILLGEQKNPYPYIANADVFVSTSMSEACPYVVNEAKILHKPIVCTNFGSIYEFITHGKDGYISTLSDLSNTLDFLFSDSIAFENLKREISLFNYDNVKILSKIEKILS